MNIRKSLSWLLVVAMLLALVPAAVAEEYDGEVGVVYRRLYSEASSVIFDDLKNYVTENSGAHLDLHFIPDADFVSSMNLKLMSGERVDAVELTCYGGDWSQLYANGNLRPVEDIFAEYAPNYFEILKNYDACWKDGHLYTVHSSQAFRRGTCNNIRRDWLDKLGMDMPATLDDYIAFLEAVKVEDVNGNGDPNDEYGICCGDPVGMFLTFFTGTTGGNWLDEEGNVWDVKSHPNYALCLDFVKMCIENGYMPSEYSTMDGAAIWDLVIADRVGTIGTWYSDVCSRYDAIWSVNPEANYEPLVPFVCVEGVQPVYTATKPYFARLAFPITGSDEGVAEVAKFLEWVAGNLTNEITCSIGIPGVHWEYTDEENAVIRVLDNTYQTKSLDYYVLIQGWDLVPAWSYSEYGNTGDRTMYEKRAQINAMPDEYFLNPIDFFLSYDYVGTPVENLIGEGKTLFEEARANYLNGDISREDFLAAQQQYIELEDAVYSAVKTEQYNQAIK